MASAPPVLTLPGCKSLSQRGLLLASVANGQSRLFGLSDCDDTLHLRHCMQQLGAVIERDGHGAEFVTGIGGAPTGAADLDVGEAGSSLRFLLALCAAGRGEFTLRGTARLMQRPHQALLTSLEKLGARFEQIDHPTKPAIRVHARGFEPGEWPVPAETSSQFISALAMAATCVGGAAFTLPSDLPSRGYFDLTLQAIRGFCGEQAVALTSTGDAQSLQIGAQPPRARTFQVPGDPSAATFMLTAIALLGRAARIEPQWEQLHPEAVLLQDLCTQGLFERNRPCWSFTKTPPPRAVEVLLDPAPDAGPGLAVLGAMLPHGMILHGVARLRAKESDRVAGIQRLLQLIGQQVELHDDSMHIPGGGVRPTPDLAVAFDPDQDHRLAMAAGLLQIVQPQLQVAHPECVAKSFPDFWQVLRRFRA